MKYKNYEAQIEFDEDAKIFHGEVINTNDVITFQGESVKELEKEFKRSIDYYLDLCKRKRIEPAKPFSGKLILRMSSDIHQKIFLSAKKAHKSINVFVNDVLKKAVF